MSSELYAALVDSFCGFLAPEAAATFRETGNFSVEEINFTLIYTGNLSPDFVYLMCELGPLGKVDEITCYRHMLGVNFLFMYQSGPQLAIHPETGMQVFISRLPFEGLTAEIFMMGLNGTIQFAKQWKSGEFLSPFSAPAQ